MFIHVFLFKPSQASSPLKRLQRMFCPRSNHMSVFSNFSLSQISSPRSAFLPRTAVGFWGRKSVVFWDPNGYNKGMTFLGNDSKSFVFFLLGGIKIIHCWHFKVLWTHCNNTLLLAYLFDPNVLSNSWTRYLYPSNYWKFSWGVPSISTFQWNPPWDPLRATLLLKRNMHSCYMAISVLNILKPHRI